jgi:hypothetical protein
MQNCPLSIDPGESCQGSSRFFYFRMRTLDNAFPVFESKHLDITFTGSDISKQGGSRGHDLFNQITPADWNLGNQLKG